MISAGWFLFLGAGFLAAVAAIVVSIGNLALCAIGGGPRVRLFRARQVVGATLGGVSMLLLGILLAGVVPHFREMFMNFDVELPTLTELVITASFVFTRLWFVTVPLMIAVIAGPFLLTFLCSERWSSVLSALLPLLSAVGCILVLVAMFMPLAQLISPLGES